MSDLVSVLLIIGAAVVGPIDGSARPDGMPPPGYVSCGLSVNCLPAKEAETIERLCERAMKEIGVGDFNGSRTGGWFGKDGWRPSNDVAGLRWPEPHVRCVPTPAGYRR